MQDSSNFSDHILSEGFCTTAGYTSTICEVALYLLGCVLSVHSATPHLMPIPTGSTRAAFTELRGSIIRYPMATLKPTPCNSTEQPVLKTGKELRGYEKFVTDESRQKGQATALAIPNSVAEVCAAVKLARKKDWAITVSGARTGITAGAVPQDGLVISFEKLNRIQRVRRDRERRVFVDCEAGVLLADLQNALITNHFGRAFVEDDTLALLKTTPHFYPPDPTETGASIGGTVACNASGAHTFRYGPTRPYVNRINVVLADGRCLELTRGQYRADNENCFLFEDENGRYIKAGIPTYAWPPTKNSGGYFTEPGMDLIDLFIGSEGTLGIITNVELRVIPVPQQRCAIVLFCNKEEQAVTLTGTLRQARDKLGIEAIEYVDGNALNMLRRRRAAIGAASGVPACLPADAVCALYLDIGTADDAFAATLKKISDAARNAGSDPEICWSAVARDERERLRVFRHALPETVNAFIAEVQKKYPDVTKLGTDMAVPDKYLEDALALYHWELNASDLDYIIFGHIGDNHLHINILPKTPQEYETGKKLYRHFAERIIEMHGSPVAEHGVGKIKKEFLPLMYGAKGVAQMKALKQTLDPENRIGRGTLFE